MRTYLRLIDASKRPNNTAIASFSLVVVPEVCNRTGMMHGGAVSMAIDMATTLAQAPLAAPGYWEFGGVSRTLSVTYLRPIPKDTEILIVCEVVQMGRALGESDDAHGAARTTQLTCMAVTIHAKVYRRADMVLLCTGEHNKAFVDIKLRHGSL